MKCRVHGIETMGADDGYGLRYIVFLQGCKGGCIYCHNVTSWNFNGGEEMDTNDIIEDTFLKEIEILLITNAILT